MLVGRRLLPPSGPARPQSNPITTATMKLALSSLLIGSAAAFAPAPAARSATQLHESKVRKRRKLSRATFDSRLSCLQVGFELQAAAVDSSSVIAEEYPITKICRLLQIATSVRVANRKRAGAYLLLLALQAQAKKAARAHFSLLQDVAGEVQPLAAQAGEQMSQK